MSSQAHNLHLLRLSYNSNVGSTNLAAVLRVTLGIKSNLLTFFQRLEALSVDSGEVYENFLTVSAVGDETVALLSVEPLNCTVIHNKILLERGSTPQL